MKTILLVETDEGVERLLGGVLHGKGLDDEYRVKRVSPDPSIKDAGPMIDDAVERSSAVIDGDGVAFILVDVSVNRGEDRHGFAIAKQLRGRYPDMPVYLTSTWLDGIRGETLVSEASFEDVDGFLTKSYAIDHLDAERIRKLRGRPRLQKAWTVERDQPAARTSEEGRISPAADAVRKKFGASADDPRVELVARTFGEETFWILVGKAAEHAHGTIDVMQPGRSGAAVLKLHVSFRPPGGNRTTERPYVLKISRDAATIAVEIANTADVGLRLPKEGYARMVSTTAHTYGGAAAALMELESDAITFRSWWSTKPTRARLDDVAGRLCDRLQALYGYRSFDRVSVWKDYFQLGDDDTVRLNAALAEVSSLRGLPVRKRELERVKLFAQTRGESEPKIMTLQTRSERGFAHNDLNSGNILITEKDQVTLIDFALAGETSVFKDLAKLQRDLLYRAMDAGTTFFSDWGRLELWRKAIPALTEDIRAAEIPRDDEVRRVITFAKAFRNTFFDQCVEGGNDVEYRCALLHYVLKAISLPDLSVQKRVLAVEHAAALIASLA